ncbi:hypothetical protein CEY12_17125 [Chryseobacterium sp. T16E-39]|uniref:hypothetical protein n=1 Tax=Chryseobacterium sp. T16E-39 TaxID=2015076 RepID=UPI000B5B10F0|nr:hypothetical protein [Chryseobacterium sp. T16E-39]ASK31730.1 hypothetical protein CEY12_17125 [Chryseobacterium sp. T16E-39]
MKIRIIVSLLLIGISSLSCSQTTQNKSKETKQNNLSPANPNLTEYDSNKKAFSDIKGIWKSQCDDKDSSIEFYDETSASIDFHTKSGLLARVNLSITKNNDSFQIRFDGLTGVTKGNADLAWVNFSRKEIIAEVKGVDENNVEIDWIGFYNEKSKQRSFVENPFDHTKKVAPLVKCN